MTSSPSADVAIVGAGFAGSEAAWQLARRGAPVALYEMRPVRSTEAHRTDRCAELVCSNSFKSVSLENAHGLLKAELAVQGSLMMEGARLHAVPAGQALAVDRDAFAAWVTARLEAEPRIRLVREEVTQIGALLDRHKHVIVASGPLTASALAEDLQARLGTGYLYFHDAIAPVIHADSLDRSIAFQASRYGRSSAQTSNSSEGDYWNCPMSREQYLAFVEAVRTAEKVPFHHFEDLRPFEGCLPIEVMVERGPMTLAFGPMKPVGLQDPRGGRPFAIVQLRQENKAGTLLGLVGFQTKMTWPEQRRVFRMIPGLEHAEFERLGSLHRNTFLNAPSLLDADLALKGEPRLSFAGQITGVEGYMESTAIGLYVAKRVAARLANIEAPRPSPRTMTGALVRYLIETPVKTFAPMNSAFGLLDPLSELPDGSVPNADKLGKKERKAAQSRRALAEMEALEAGSAPATHQSAGVESLRRLATEGTNTNDDSRNRRGAD
jgi:methylenetetrahydrofolate--tRNA-(uracil-5-)-methyltransferase